MIRVCRGVRLIVGLSKFLWPTPIGGLAEAVSCEQRHWEQENSDLFQHMNNLDEVVHRRSHLVTVTDDGIFNS